MTHTLSVAWDGDNLVASVGPFRFIIALVEAYSEGGATAFLYGWDCADWPNLPVSAKKKPVDDSTYGGAEIRCLSEEEARRVVAALFGVRGIEVPP